MRSVPFDVRQTTVWTIPAGTTFLQHVGHNVSDTTCTVISGTTHVLEKRVPDPSGLRTAEGRRRDRDLKLLVSPSDPTCIYIRPYDPTTIYAYDPYYYYYHYHHYYYHRYRSAFWTAR